MRELLLKIKMMLMAPAELEVPREITNKSPYYCELANHNIRIFEAGQKIFVVLKNKIILRSDWKFFKVIYSKSQDLFIFKIQKDGLESSQMFEVDKEKIIYLEALSGYKEFIQIEDMEFLLLRDQCRSLVFDYSKYSKNRIVMVENTRIYWLDQPKLFVKLVDGGYSLLFPRVEEDGITSWTDKKDYVFSSIPKDTLAPQLVGEKVIKLSLRKADILDTFEGGIKAVSWLPKPYTHIARKDRWVYFIGITDDYVLQKIEGNSIRPLVPDCQELQNYFVVQNGKRVTIVEYDEKENELVGIGSFLGSDIKMAKPELELKEGYIKIPLKLVQERALSDQLGVF